MPSPRNKKGDETKRSLTEKSVNFGQCQRKQCIKEAISLMLEKKRTQIYEHVLTPYRVAAPVSGQALQKYLNSKRQAADKVLNQTKILET